MLNKSTTSGSIPAPAPAPVEPAAPAPIPVSVATNDYGIREFSQPEFLAFGASHGGFSGFGLPPVQISEGNFLRLAEARAVVFYHSTPEALPNIAGFIQVQGGEDDRQMCTEGSFVYYVLEEAFNNIIVGQAAEVVHDEYHG